MRQYLFSLMVVAGVLVAPGVEAAAIRLVPETAKAASQVAVQVLFDPEGADVNAMSGNVTFSSGLLSLVGIDDGSVVGLWVDPPSLTAAGSITFSGITPGGFSPGRARMFTLHFQAKDVGMAQFATKDLALFADDGKATLVPLRDAVAQAHVAGHPLSDFMAETPDVLPPEPFTPQLGRDPSIEDGAWFVAFVATDKGNGIADYQVLESRNALDVAKLTGHEADWHDATSPYVLRDQTRQSWVYVRAVDRNGNARVATIGPSEYRLGAFRGIMVGIALLIIILLLWRYLAQHRSRL